MGIMDERIVKRIVVGIHRDYLKTKIKTLKDAGYTNAEISKAVRLPESTVRVMLTQIEDETIERLSKESE